MTKRALSRFWPGRSGVLPGFGLTLGYTLTYLGLIVILPLSALVIKAFGIDARRLLGIVTEPRILSSFLVSFETSILAASINAVMGTLIAWVLVRHPVPLRGAIDAIIDLPFALPTAVAGIALTALLSHEGVVTKLIGTTLAFTQAGIVVALAFVGLPFVVRTVQPAVENIPNDIEEAASILGASRWQTLRRVVLPRLWPSVLTGFAIAFARGLGEYGSVVFISGNMPGKTEIVPLLIVTRLEQYDYEGAATVATLLLVLSFASLFAINLLEKRLLPGGRK